MSKLIPLTQGYNCIVDDSDYDWLSKFNWYYCNGYASRVVWKNGTSSRVYMHRLILGLKDRTMCDHKNRNRLDNQRANLRVANRSQQSANAPIRSHNHSGVKGVRFMIDRKNPGTKPKWTAQIMFNQKLIHLGRFLTQKEAGEAYDAAALVYFGDFAATNKSMGLIT